MLPRGGTKNFFWRAYARKLCPPLNKSPRTPLGGKNYELDLHPSSLKFDINVYCLGVVGRTMNWICILVLSSLILTFTV